MKKIIMTAFLFLLCSGILYAAGKISEMTPVTTPAGTDLFETSQLVSGPSRTTRSETLDQITTYVTGSTTISNVQSKLSGSCPGAAIAGYNTDNTPICQAVSGSSGVVSFATRTGIVTPQAGDYSSFYAPASANTGTNTGDETQATIISKLTFTPLAPTGDGASLSNVCHPSEIDGHAGVTLTATQLTCKGILSTYGQVASNVTSTLPTAAANLVVIVTVGTAQASNYYRVAAASAGSMYLDGSATGKDYVQFSSPAVGNNFACVTFKTGSSAYSWICQTGAGTTSTN